ncbi:regulator of telomere elongation helicase 1 isoform 2-T2 [Synchiropus picturatus]
MPLLSLSGVTVNFPFPPYGCQTDYMNKVIECLQRKVNGVLESPTGTGKTLCLLCATLAWREHFKDSISARKIAEKLGGQEMFPNTPLSSWGTAATDGETTTYYTDVPKIIYASRTHSQLAQVVDELRNTSYRPKVCVLGSREQLCINPEVMRQESNHIKVHMCRAKVSTRSCMFYNNVEEKCTDKNVVDSILDVEDLVKYGNKQKVCPYYLSRSLKQQADVIFMPYNYLLDPKSRRAHNIELKGAVVIFDEAHNVEKTCEETTSFDLTPYDLASAISAVDRLLAEKANEVRSGESFSSDNVESLNPASKLDISMVAKIKQILLDLEAAIDSFDVPNDKGFTKPGIFIYELLARAHLTYDTKTAVHEVLEQICGYLAGQPGVFLNTSGLQKLSDIIQVVFCGEPESKDRQRQMAVNTTHFKVHIHKDNSHHKKKNTDVWASSTAKKQGNILSYWCFSPGFSMQELVNQEVRSIILTSGTLSPLTSFMAEMRIMFDVTLENSHVIERDQIFVRVIDRGPDGVMLSSAFDRRFVPANMASLGNTVANLSRVVPHGLLVFFPSFPLMEKTLEFWRANGHSSRIENMKPVFVEPKGKGTFNEVMDAYYSKVDDASSKGATFMAVCRGKASEGLDFANMYGRGVIITGLPFPPKLDPRVQLKMQFLDEMNRGRAGGLKFLTGQEWYREQAFRAVNQAIGRVIRHKDDFGAIFLCDQRFQGTDAKAHLPSWVRPCVRHGDSFGNVVRDVSQFFRVAHKLRPVTENKGPAKSCEPAFQSDPQPCSSVSSSCVTQKAKMLDSHIPSLKRRRLNDHTGASAMARICIEYETEAPESHRKPASLLAALEQGDHHRKDGGTDSFGVEKASRLSTLSLQCDKRMDEELRGGKRKIKVVQEQNGRKLADIIEKGKASTVKNVLIEMKKSLSQVTFEQVMEALQTYKKTNNLDTLLSQTAVLLEDANTHSLLRGFYRFVRAHHKKQFDEKCLELTGVGCGYKPEHSLSTEEKKAMLTSAAEGATCSSSATSTSHQLSTQQLNHGGRHLSSDGLQQVSADERRHLRACTSADSTKTRDPAAFLADVKKALTPEQSAQLFRAISSYKETDDYESLVSIVVSLFTEKDDHFQLLARFAKFVKPHHKKQYRELLEALIDGYDPATYEKKEATQRKLTSFFSASQNI